MLASRTAPDDRTGPTIESKIFMEEEQVLLRLTLLLIASLLLLAVPNAGAEEGPEEELETDREAGYVGFTYLFSDPVVGYSGGEWTSPSKYSILP